jgi:hypothetical protein
VPTRRDKRSLGTSAPEQPRPDPFPAWWRWLIVAATLLAAVSLAVAVFAGSASGHPTQSGAAAATVAPRLPAGELGTA